jgi:Domain of unknown function (DUF4331)
MKHFNILAASSILLGAALSSGMACSSSSSGTTTGTGGTSTASNAASTSGTGGTTTSSGTGGATNPAPPTIGTTQIDRIGRPAINTALNHVFDPTATSSGPAKDDYNENTDSTTWSSKYGPEFAKNLAILDALDGVCGNQLLAAAASGGTIPATRYQELSGALANDVLYVNTAGTACTQYLAVEATALAISTTLGSDCGGRALTYDVIDTSYSVLAAGSFMGVGDGVPKNDVDFLTTFPYLAAPH